MTILDDYFGLLFQRSISDACFRGLFQMTFPDDCLNDYFGCLRMTVSDYCSRWIFRRLVSDDFPGWLFVIPRLIRILATNSYFHGRFLFQPITQLIGPTTDSILNDCFLLQNYGPDPSLIYRPEEAKWKRGLDHLLFKRRLRSWTAPS